MHNSLALIGSSSFLANYIYQHFVNDFRVVGFSRNNVLNIEEYHFFDYPSTPIDFNMLLEFDVIIYCAGGGIQGNEKDDIIYSLNTFLPLSMALFLDSHQYKGKLVTFGSYFEIGNNSDEKKFTEEDVLNSSLSVPNQYCLSKRLLSKFFQGVNISYQYYHLILPTIFGKGENPKRLIPYLINTLIKNGSPVLTSGLQTRQYIHAGDVSALVKLIIQSDILSGIYNIPCYETLLVRDVVSKIYKGLGSPFSPKSESLQRYDESMKYLALDPSKLLANFPEWNPQFPIEKTINDYKI